MNDFYVGQKVVCVDVSEPFSAVPMLTKGAVYTVSGVDADQYLSLVELPPQFGDRQKWFQSRFRPLEEKPDAIEWARKICRDVEAGARTPESVA